MASTIIALWCTTFILLCTANAAEISSEETPVEDSAQNTAHESNPGETTEAVGIKVPYASVPVYLTHLARSEQEIYRKFLNYEKQLQDRLQILQRLLRDYENSAQLAINVLDANEVDEWNKATLISSHPILSYKMIRRFVTDFQSLTENIWQGLESDLWESLESIRGKLTWPSHDDLISSTKSLIRLQDTHDLEIHDFVDGRLPQFRLHFGLTARECLDISQQALDFGNVHASTEWWQGAHYKAFQQKDESIHVDELTHAWTQSYEAFKKVWPLEVFETHDVFSESKVVLRNHFESQKFNLTLENAQITYKALCRGDNFQPVTSQLDALAQICYYENTLSPYYYINPLQIEVYSWDPIVYQVHNFVPQTDLIELSHEIVPAVVSAVELGHYQPETSSKTFTRTLVEDNIWPQLHTLNHKIFKLPALDMYLDVDIEPSRYLGITTFAVGGHYEPCFKCFSDDESEATGKRISSVHVVVTSKHLNAASIHLHPPDLGGEFVFPLLGVKVTPIVGSVIVHSEVNTGGNLDERTLHGGCPVLLGEKWILTRHFHEIVIDQVQTT